MKVAIVIPHYIATSELVRLATNTINSIHKTSDVFVISVDDGSPTDTGFLEVSSDHTIHLKENGGFAVACNTGFEWAIEHDFEYIGCANNDIEVYGDWLEQMLRPFVLFEQVGLTGLISSKERVIDGVPIEKYVVPKMTEGGLLNHYMQSGGLLLSTKKVLEDVGLYDERFKIGGEEDVDLFLRIRDKYKIVMSGYSCFWHKEGATRWNDEIESGFREKNKQLEQTNYDSFKEKWGWDIRTDGLHFYEDVLEERGKIIGDELEL